MIFVRTLVIGGRSHYGNEGTDILSSGIVVLEIKTRIIILI